VFRNRKIDYKTKAFFNYYSIGKVFKDQSLKMPSFAFEKRGKYRVLGFFSLSGNLSFFQKK
jgi:hypothetical protein